MITLYYTPTCSICAALSEKLKSLKVPFIEKDMSDTEVFADIVTRYNYVMEAPLIEDNGIFIEKPDIEQWLKRLVKQRWLTV